MQQQKQKGLVAPQLYRQMDLIHMAMPELETHLELALAENPLLELEEPEETAELELEDGDADDGDEDMDWEELLLDGLDGWSARGSSQQSDRTEPVAVAQVGLHGRLSAQIGEALIDSRTALVCEEIVGNIDDEGFLDASVNEIREGVDLRLATAQGDQPCSAEEIETALRVVQDFDPPGVGARDRRESLLIQLWRRGEEYTLAYLVVHCHFARVLNGRWSEIAKDLAVAEELVRGVVDQLAKLNPRPASSYAGDAAPTVVPDLSVRIVDGQYRVFLNDGRLPRLRISESYREVAQSGRLDSDSRGFIRERLGAAQWMVQALEQRRQTILRVMEFIVERQRDFLEKGAKHLRPMTLADVAEATEMHQSTVSRATHDKYVDTPRGVLPLRYFFSSSLGTVEGGEISSTAVQARIRALLNSEQPDNPMSDSKIAATLKADGVRVARRTVAKYRDRMGILPARLRRSP